MATLGKATANTTLENKIGTCDTSRMNQALLTRTHHTPRPSLKLFDEVDFTLARVHEICGMSRRTLAMMIAAKAGGPVFWIAPPWGSDPLNPDGMREFVSPQDFLFLAPRRPEDVLWCMEEILRSGAAPLVVADIPSPPGLTPIRRLHLAAETGAAEGTHQPLGLILTPGEGGAQGVESRWQMMSTHLPDQRSWVVSRLRARTAPQKTWRMLPKEDTFELVPRTEPG